MDYFCWVTLPVSARFYKSPESSTSTPSLSYKSLEKPPTCPGVSQGGTHTSKDVLALTWESYSITHIPDRSRSRAKCRVGAQWQASDTLALGKHRQSEFYTTWNLLSWLVWFWRSFQFLSRGRQDRPFHLSLTALISIAACLSHQPLVEQLARP